MTKTKKRKPKPAPARFVVSDELLYLLGFATNAVEATQEAFADRYFRPVVDRVLAGHGMNPVELLARRKANRS